MSETPPSPYNEDDPTTNPLSGPISNPALLPTTNPALLPTTNPALLPTTNPALLPTTNPRSSPASSQDAVSRQARILHLQLLEAQLHLALAHIYRGQALLERAARSNRC